jgi:phosphoglycolate phosphatase
MAETDAIFRWMTTRHVVWDWNGTLLDDVWLCVDVLNGMLRARGLPEVNENYYREVFSFPVINVYKRMGFDTSDGRFEKMSVEYIDAYQARRGECKLHADALAVLASVKQSGVGQSILSAYQQNMLDSMIANMGLNKYFDKLAGNTNIFAASKVDYGRSLLKEIGGDPREIVMVGDTEHDYEVAKELGLRCILVSHGHNSPNNLVRLGVTVVPSLKQVAAEIGITTHPLAGAANF